MIEAIPSSAILCSTTPTNKISSSPTSETKRYLEFSLLLKECNTNEIELRDNYDAVFHLVTAAKGAEEFYTLENNTARTETKEEAIKSDDNLIKAWNGHPHFRIIDNSTNFDDKIKKLLKKIF